MIYEKYYMSSPGHLKWKDIYALREPSSFHTKCFCLGQNKILLFPKNFHPGSRKFIFLNQISDDILFFSSVFYAFFDSCLLFVCLFVRCFFLKLKMYILIHILIHFSSKQFLDIQATIECKFTLKTGVWHDTS